MILSSSVLSTKIILFFLSYCLSLLVEDEGIVREEEGKMRENEERRVWFFLLLHVLSKVWQGLLFNGSQTVLFGYIRV